MAAIADSNGEVIADPETLFAEQDAMADEYCHLRALHGPGGTWDHLRKTLFHTVRVEIRDDYVKRGEKVTESYLDDLARKHERYVKFEDEGTGEKAQYAMLEIKMARIAYKFDYEKSRVYYVAAQMRLV